MQPLLNEKELISTFLSTLASLFYEHLIGTATTDFTTFIQAVQRIEDGIKTGKVLDYSKFHFLVKQNPSKRHELKIIPNARESVSTIEFFEKSKRRQKKERRDQVFKSLPEPIDLLFLKLLVANLIIKMPQRAIPKQLSRFYDHSIQCEYHSDEVEHDMNNCWPLKRRIQELINNGSLLV